MVQPTMATDAVVERLRVERDQAQGRLDAALLNIEVLKNDIRIIANALKYEAEGRGWCSEYKDFVDTVNNRCSDAHLLPCANRYLLRYTVEVEVSADDVEEAERQVCGELQVDEIEAGQLRRAQVSQLSRERVEE